MSRSLWVGLLLLMTCPMGACGHEAVTPSEDPVMVAGKQDAGEKLNVRLLQMANEVQAQGKPLLLTARAYGFHVDNGLILEVMLTPDSPDPDADFQRAGAEVLLVSEKYGRATLRILEIEVLDKLADLPAVHRINPVYPPVRR